MQAFDTFLVHAVCTKYMYTCADISIVDGILIKMRMVKSLIVHIGIG